MEFWPPVNFLELVNSVITDIKIAEKIKILLELKQHNKECDMEVVDTQLREYVQHWAEYYNNIVDSYRPKFEKSTFDVLNKILFDMVTGHIQEDSDKKWGV